jgi:phosphohistidine swiveling domain-containing protein
VLLELSAQPSAQEVGAKAARLGWMAGQGWPVPAGVVAPFRVGAALVHPGGPPPALRSALEQRLDCGGRYAVRSSANAEDHGARSFAGQFTSVLDVAPDDVVEAMTQVAASVGSSRATAYARRIGLDPGSLRMAVIVQEMVDASVSGVAFSRNPLDGAPQVVVEAVRGRGERLVGRGETPQRWILERDQLLEQPAAPLVERRVLDEVVGIVTRIETMTGSPADVEWLWDGSMLHLVQWRPVTGADRPARVWSARLAKDMLPGLIPPLVWSVNVPAKSQVVVDLLDRALGPTGLDPTTLVREFGYRAYFDMGALGSVFSSLGLPADALEQMRAGDQDAPMRPSVTAVAVRAPRLGRFLLGLRRWERTVTEQVDGLTRERDALAAVVLDELPDSALVDRVDTIGTLYVRASLLNIVTPLLADAWAASVRRAARRSGLEAARLEPGAGRPEVAALDPAHALAELDPQDPAGWEAFLRRFGHLSDSPNDCSRVTWAEQPEQVRAMVGDGRRLPVDALGPDDAAAHLLAATPRWQRPLVNRSWQRASALRLARERMGYTYARVYALYRPTFLEIARRLVAAGVLDHAEDVFLLGWDEVRTALDGRLADASSLVDARRAEMAEAAELSWPERIVGDDPVPVRGRASARALSGVAAAPGRHVGPARVVTSLTAASDVGVDDVLVLEAPDVTWTPLLLRAGAVVTESGGMLAHAAIVAREVGVPCVASVAGATLIPDGSIVCVDGWSGDVLVLDPQEQT